MELDSLMEGENSICPESLSCDLGAGRKCVAQYLFECSNAVCTWLDAPRGRWTFLHWLGAGGWAFGVGGGHSLGTCTKTYVLFSLLAFLLAVLRGASLDLKHQAQE